MSLSQKADFFRQQHHQNTLLLLPNVWDILTARLMVSAGFQSLATASFSVAATNGYQDGEKIPFDRLIEVVARIAGGVDVPVSVDFERGYASDLSSLGDNIKRLVEAGAIGVNIEDRSPDGKGLITAEAHCKKIETIREAGIKSGVNIVINARTDAYLLKLNEHYLAETIERGKAYQKAGADCFYPVAMDNYSDIERVVGEVSLPMNVLLTKPVADLGKLEKLGVKRVSLGPGTLRYVVTKLKTMAAALHHYDTTELFAQDLLTGPDVMSLVK